MARWLCLGGAGFIGSTFALHTARAGDDVCILDDLRAGGGSIDHLLSRSAKLSFVRAAIEDTAAVAQALESFRPDGIVHFAAEIDVARSVREPEFYQIANVDHTVSLLKTLQAWRRASGLAPVFVFSSTAAVYGQPDSADGNDAIRESTTTNPINPYGRTKLEVESILRKLVDQEAWRVVCLRYFNAAGAWSDEGLGECHHPETHLIPLAIDAALGLTPPVQIYGTDYPTPDGTAVRDYIHVRDLAEAHRLALHQLLSAAPPAHGLNLGTGQGASVREVFAHVADLTGSNVAPLEAPRRQGDPARLVADPALLNQWLGWKAQYSLREMIVDAWRFRVKHGA